MFWLGQLLSRTIRMGSVTVIDAHGRAHCFGNPDDQRGAHVTVRLCNRTLPWKLAINPQRYVGEAYTDGSLQIVSGDLWDLLELCGANLALGGRPTRGAIARALIRFLQRVIQINSRVRSRQNAAAHYDLPKALYAAFLDRDLQYSCAYFASSHMTLDQAQSAKKRHIAAKLLLEPGQRLLDIGCGWGGLTVELARDHGVYADGITLSREQANFANDLAEALNLGGRVKFSLCDYRDISGCYDRVVSIGMFEHVGTPQYGRFFKRVKDLLAPDGIALVHTIGTTSGPGLGNSWIRKHIFPGGYAPALSEIIPAIEKAGLFVTDIEILRLHYAQTLRHWRARFMANWESIKPLYDDRFRRMWEFYLASSEMSFRFGDLVVFQIQLAKSVSAPPLTRDYIYEFEHRTTSGMHLPNERAA